MAQSGDWKGTLTTTGRDQEAKLYVTLTDLQVGVAYHAHAFVQTDEIAHFYVDQGDAVHHATVVRTIGNSNFEWVNRGIEFTAVAERVEVGLHVPVGMPTHAAIDNLFVTRIELPDIQRYEAERAACAGCNAVSTESASAGAYIDGLDEKDDAVEFTITANSAGEYRLTINYAHAQTRHERLKLEVNGETVSTLRLPGTGSADTFSANVVHVAVVLSAGSNTITLSRSRSGAPISVDYIETHIW
jgi:hypothetical protein